jgi:hypothetical protein
LCPEWARALEALDALMSDERFSRRFGHGPEEAEITIREDAPEDLRGALLMIAEGELALSPGRIRKALCTALRKTPDPGNWTAYPNVWDECQRLMEEAPWHRIYDFVERIYLTLRESGEDGDLKAARRWEELVNEYFVDSGVGWKMVGGLLQSRGTEAFEAAVASASEALPAAALPTARQETHEALRDLSRRPEPDLTGAIQHALAALECTAREAAVDQRATLGEILRRRPDLFPKPLDEALSKLWGYASETGRHLREGRAPERAEVELVVGVAASACTYLATKLRRR